MHLIMTGSLIHVNGYDKLKSYELPIHRKIDELSRQVIWLKEL